MNHPRGAVLAYVLALVLGLSGPPELAAQLETPAASPAATLVQRIGLTDFTLRYSRPGIRGRRIFGELLPYDQVWRTGANEATLLTFSRPVIIGNERLLPGTYALYSIPGPQQWTWIINRDTSLWGDRGYDPALDRLRLSVDVEPLSERVETMEFRFLNLDFASADLALEWEYCRVRLPLRLETDAQVDEQIEQVLAGNPSGEDYYRAARYYLDKGGDLPTARRWMEKRVEMGGEQFGILRYKALIEWKLGDSLTARHAMNRSLELARQAGNAHYIRMNEASLREWTPQAAPLPAETILNRSIAYHDPAGEWDKGRFEWTLFESRPGADYRLTELLIDNDASLFRLSQQRGRNHIFRELGPNGCLVRFNEATEFAESDIRSFRLRCADNEVIRDYYTYLWGLPMKLKDPGARLHPEAQIRDFLGKECYQLKVTYDPETGTDTWYFYFDPHSFALQGYRFYHDEQKNDGEYILLSAEVADGNLRLPARREWFSNADRRFLGTDELIRTGPGNRRGRE